MERPGYDISHIGDGQLLDGAAPTLTPLPDFMGLQPAVIHHLSTEYPLTFTIICCTLVLSKINEQFHMKLSYLLNFTILIRYSTDTNRMLEVR